MAEEFQESEVIFSENSAAGLTESEDDFHQLGNLNSVESRTNKLKRKKKQAGKENKSVPVNIPETKFSGSSWFHYMEPDLSEDGEMVPPHEIMGRRVAGKMAFSVCSGNGRTLKGRDLSEVRNSILKMTGFLET